MSKTYPSHSKQPLQPTVTQWKLSNLVGSRDVTAHFWLTHEQGRLKVCVIPTSSKNQQTLQPLAEDLRDLFMAGRSLNEPNEWEDIIGDTPSTAQR